MRLFPESRKFLLYARQIEIRGVDIDNPYYNYIISFTVPDIDNVTVVDYDAVEHRIYWSDVRTQTIKRAFINGTGVETVVSAGRSNPRDKCCNNVKSISSCTSWKSNVPFFVSLSKFSRPSQWPRPGSRLGVQEPLLDQL